jgi:ankyrin repeat protein
MNDFIEAVSRNNISKVDFLLQNKMANVNHNEGEALNIVCYNGSLELFNLLIKQKNIKMGQKSSLDLREASENGHTEIVRTLLTYKDIDVNSFEQEAVSYSSSNGHVDILKLLLADNRLKITKKFANIAIESFLFEQKECVYLLFQLDIVKNELKKDKVYYPLISSLIKSLNIKKNAKNF